jgi:hypothetical protein
VKHYEGLHCERYYKNENYLLKYAHNLQIFKFFRSETNGIIAYHCNCCPEKFGSIPNLVSHKTGQHAKDAKIKCIPCDRDFSYLKAKYKTHLQTDKHAKNVGKDVFSKLQQQK